jgi:hypothetical protein
MKSLNLAFALATLAVTIAAPYLSIGPVAPPKTFLAESSPPRPAQLVQTCVGEDDATDSDDAATQGEPRLVSTFLIAPVQNPDGARVPVYLPRYD